MLQDRLIIRYCTILYCSILTPDLQSTMKQESWLELGQRHFIGAIGHSAALASFRFS